MKPQLVLKMRSVFRLFSEMASVIGTRIEDNQWRTLVKEKQPIAITDFGEDGMEACSEDGALSFSFDERGLYIVKICQFDRLSEFAGLSMDAPSFIELMSGGFGAPVRQVPPSDGLLGPAPSAVVYDIGWDVQINVSYNEVVEAVYVFKARTQHGPRH